MGLDQYLYVCKKSDAEKVANMTSEDYWTWQRPEGIEQYYWRKCYWVDRYFKTYGIPLDEEQIFFLVPRKVLNDLLKRVAKQMKAIEECQSIIENKLDPLLLDEQDEVASIGAWEVEMTFDNLKKVKNKLIASRSDVILYERSY